MNDNSLGVIVGVAVFCVGAASLTVGHYATAGWWIWYMAIVWMAFLIAFAVSLRKD